jgi:Zn-dependent peptidase ImmA (M78 family)
MLNTGDFQEIIDFQVDFDKNSKRFLSAWRKDESEMTFNDCMSPQED